jgi:hypothetical protein
MIGASAATPAGWSGLFIEWMHPAAIGFAILFPLIRGAIRRQKSLAPCFNAHSVVHDAASGFTIPSFFALIFSSLSPNIMPFVDGHSAALAGIMGVVYTLGGILNGHHK